MQSRRDQLGVIILCCVALIIGGCSNGDGTEGIAASSKSNCSSSKSCPIADAGPDQTVLVGSQITLDGSASSSGTGGLITYQWTLTSQPAGSTATLAGATTVRPSFTPVVAGDYSVQLVVDNAGLLSKSDTVVITADTGNPLSQAMARRLVS